jgi:hypothetical protein
VNGHAEILSVVEANLDNDKIVALDAIHQAMFLTDPPGPVPAQILAQKFGSADALSGRALALGDHPIDALYHWLVTGP